MAIKNGLGPQIKWTNYGEFKIYMDRNGMLLREETYAVYLFVEKD